MTQEYLPWIACGLCFAIGLAAVILTPKGLASWCFFIGMILLAAERLLDQKAAEAQSENWLMHAMWVKSLLPLFWLVFSLTYARGNRADFVRRWLWILVVAMVVP